MNLRRSGASCYRRSSIPERQQETHFAAYTIQIAKQLSSQLERFVTLNPHQLAGHVANLDFWSNEVAHSIEVLDGYRSRFKRLAEAQAEYISRKRTIEFKLDDVWGETRRQPARPSPLPDRERVAARTELCDAFYRFVARCCRAGLIDETDALAECARHSIGVDRRDLRDRSSKGR